MGIRLVGQLGKAWNEQTKSGDLIAVTLAGEKRFEVASLRNQAIKHLAREFYYYAI